MANTPTTASRLTDEEILNLAELQNELGNSSSSYVLRDYVRMRKLNGELSNCVRDAISLNCALCKSRHTVACDMDGFCSERRWKKVLAEAEKGETK